MKKILYTIIFFAAALASCSKSGLEESAQMAPGININLRMAGATKAAVTMDGEDALNEKKIEAINYFIFATDTDEADLLLSGTKTIEENIGSEGKTVNLGITEEQFAKIFENRTKLTIYIIGNAADVLKGKAIASLAELKATILTIENEGGRQNSFVMTGSSAELEEGATKNDSRCASATVELRRVLAKVNLKMTLSDSIEIPCRNDGTKPDKDEETELAIKWTADASQAKVSFHNLASEGRLDGANDYVSKRFDLDETKRSFVVNKGETAYDCTVNECYYTYPCKWNLSDENKPYFMITVPWSSELTGNTEGKDISWFKTETKPCYYKVVLNNSSFDSNNWYAVFVVLKGLGSFSPSTAVEITDLQLTVADWRNAMIEAGHDYDTEAEFQEARVLDISQKEITLYNEEDAMVAFTSSHECEIVSVGLEMYDYTQIPPAKITDQGKLINPAQFTIDNEKNVIKFHHTLVNDLKAPNFDYQEFVFTVEMRHKDAAGHDFKDKLKIIQRPALVVSAEMNSAGTDASKRTNYVNNTQSGSDWQFTNSNMKSSYNNNPVMFVISSSVFNDGRIIGDPRTDTPESFTGMATAKAVKGTDRTLNSYYRADLNKSNFIAPKLRVASSWGRVSGDMSFNDAVKRCAAYQEDGYPAGRWRMPTEQEVEFMTTLSSKNYIDKLFESGRSSYYWCNSGNAVNISSSGEVSFSSRTRSYVRCVYDEWYWENSEYAKVDTKTFTWGDMTRGNFE